MGTRTSPTASQSIQTSILNSRALPSPVQNDTDQIYLSGKEKFYITETKEMISRGQGDEPWLKWESGEYGDASPSDGTAVYAKTNVEFWSDSPAFRNGPIRSIRAGRRTST